ncbi:MAG: 2-phosphosulfolactate phosphatase [Gemmatimonadota bacterium]|nr:2-phosphosulfolactate phosphatase [Gemmatimonadota bacterium]
MRIDVFLTPAEFTPAHAQARVVTVIDVLRAATSIAVALVNGARNVVPLEDAEEVIKRAKAFDRSEVVLAGERRMQPISGFDLGNSPREFAADTVDGKTVLLATTNGTPAIAAVQGAREVIIASYVNFTPVLTLLRTAVRGETDLAIVCAGRERQFALEDAACAGRFVRHVAKAAPAAEMNDAAHAAVLIERRYNDRIDRVFADSEHGRALAETGYAADLETCAALDAFPVIAVYQDRQITMIGPGRER